jgi:hypothetical protein
MHLEKIFTLLNWLLPLRIVKALRMERIMFLIWAYPSWIVVARKV